MRRQIIITALTRMAKPRVCVAGYDPQTQVYVRPVIPYQGVTEPYLVRGGKLAIKPFALVEFDFLCPEVSPPHTEDWVINTKAPYQTQGFLAEDQRTALLQQIAQSQVSDLFGIEVVENRIPAGQGARSLGVIKAQVITRVMYREERDGRYKLRLSFVDQAGVHYESVPVTDMAAYHFCQHQRVGKRVSPSRICPSLVQTLNRQDAYLHLGLARPFAPTGGSPMCFLQVIGIFSVPDFLAGKDYTDFLLAEQKVGELDDDAPF